MSLLYDVKLKNLYGIKGAKSTMRIWVGTGSTDHKATIEKEVKKEWGNFAELDSYSPVKSNGKRPFGIGIPYGPEDR